MGALGLFGSLGLFPIKLIRLIGLISSKPLQAYLSAAGLPPIVTQNAAFCDAGGGVLQLIGCQMVIKLQLLRFTTKSRYAVRLFLRAAVRLFLRAGSPTSVLMKAMASACISSMRRQA